MVDTDQTKSGVKIVPRKRRGPKNQMNTALLLFLGGRIRKLRMEKGWSVAHLGNRSMVDQNYLGQIERGQKDYLITTLGRLATGLGVPLAELFTAEEPSFKEVKKDDGFNDGRDSIYERI